MAITTIALTIVAMSSVPENTLVTINFDIIQYANRETAGTRAQPAIAPMSRHLSRLLDGHNDRAVLIGIRIVKIYRAYSATQSSMNQTSMAMRRTKRIIKAKTAPPMKPKTPPRSIDPPIALIMSPKESPISLAKDSLRSLPRVLTQCTAVGVDSINGT